MTSAHFVLPEGWPRPKGYSNAVVLPAGRPIFVAGMVGWDEQERIVCNSFAGQFRQALKNIREVVEAAGGGVEFIGRMTIYVADVQKYTQEIAEVGRAYREVFGKHFPAMTLVEVSRLLEEGALVEIEATGVLPEGRKNE